jgi:hypothetical protein
MPQTGSISTRSPPRPLALAGLAAAGLLLAGTLAMWAHYGTAVFYEIVRAGLAACF